MAFCTTGCIIPVLQVLKMAVASSAFQICSVISNDTRLSFPRSSFGRKRCKAIDGGGFLFSTACVFKPQFAVL